MRRPGPHPVVVVEDAHWADEATLDWLSFLGRRIARIPALLVVTYRDDEVGTDHPLRRTLAALPSAVTSQVPTVTTDQFASPEAWLAYWKTVYGPTIAVYRAIAGDPDRVAATYSTVAPTGLACKPVCMSDSPEELLADTLTLRRRARADRHVYWLPLLFFGLAIVGSAPLYVERLQVRGGGDPAATLYWTQTDPRLGPYWTVALLGGALLSAWWYRRCGRRIGIEGTVGPAVVAATLLAIGLLVAGVLPLGGYLWPLWVHDYRALLLIAVGLLALAVQERSRELGIIAVLFTVAAVLANTYNVENVVFRLGWDPFVAHPDQARFVHLPALAAPAAVLLLGGAVAGLRARRVR